MNSEDKINCDACLELVSALTIVLEQHSQMLRHLGELVIKIQEQNAINSGKLRAIVEAVDPNPRIVMELRKKN